MAKHPRAVPATLNHEPAGLRYALEQSGLTQRQLAAQVGKSEGMVSEWLRGTRSITNADLNAIARILNCPRVVLEAKRDPEGDAA